MSAIQVCGYIYDFGGTSNLVRQQPLNIYIYRRQNSHSCIINMLLRFCTRLNIGCGQDDVLKGNRIGMNGKFEVGNEMVKVDSDEQHFETDKTSQPCSRSCCVYDGGSVAEWEKEEDAVFERTYFHVLQ